MAQMHNKAGQFCKTEAMKRAQMIFLGVCLFAMACTAFSTFTILRLNGWIGVVINSAALAALYAGSRVMDKRLDIIAKERIKYLCGGQAEAFVAWLLQDLGHDWHVFNNIELVAGSDHDHAVVGPGGLYFLSTKSFLGMFTREQDGRIFYNGKPTRLITDTLTRAMELKKRLEAIMGSDVPFVEAVLAVPFCYVDFGGKGNSVWVLNENDLVKIIDGGRAKLQRSEIERIVRALEILSVNAKDTYRRPERQSPSRSTVEAVEGRRMV